MLQFIQSTYRDFLSFLKQPKQLQENNVMAEKGKRLLAVLLLELPIMFVLIILISLFEEMGWVDTSEHKLLELMETLPMVALLIAVVLVAPFFEELIFRFPLKYKRNYLLQLLVAIVGVLSFGRAENVQEKARHWWERCFFLTFYLSAVIFGLVHIFNYADLSAVLVFIPLLIAPQLILGLFLGYLRMKQGFVWSFYLHALHNLIFVGGALWSISQMDTKEIAGDGFRMQYETLEASLGTNTDDIQVYRSKDSVGMENLAIKPLLAQLLYKPEDFIRIIPEEKGDKRINLHFKQLVDSLNAEEVILQQLQKELKFSLSPDSTATPAWGLVVTDSSLLNSIKANEQHQAKTISSKEKFSLQPAGMEALSSLLANASDSVIVDNTGLEGLYELEISRTSFEEMRSQLQAYGLDLQYMKNSPEYVVVTFEE